MTDDIHPKVAKVRQEVDVDLTFDKRIGDKVIEKQFKAELDVYHKAYVQKSKREWHALKPKTFLLHGKSGTGKTMLVHCFANYAGLQYIYNIGNDDLGNRAESLFHPLLEIAQKSQSEPTVILFDEIDKIIRTEVRERSMFLFLDQIKKCPWIFVFFTTNYPFSLIQKTNGRESEGALLRRVYSRYFIRCLGFNDRKKFIKFQLHTKFQGHYSLTRDDITHITRKLQNWSADEIIRILSRINGIKIPPSDGEYDIIGRFGRADVDAILNEVGPGKRAESHIRFAKKHGSYVTEPQLVPAGELRYGQREYDGEGAVNDHRDHNSNHNSNHNVNHNRKRYCYFKFKHEMLSDDEH